MFLDFHLEKIFVSLEKLKSLKLKFDRKMCELVWFGKGKIFDR